MTICRRSRGAAAILGLALFLGGPASEASPRETPWIAAAPGYSWSFPRDHWAHPGYKTEWWYFTGHLTPRGSAVPRFGYQFTVFRVGLNPERLDLDSAWNTETLIMGHASISDLETGRHIFSDVLYRAAPLLGGFPAYPGRRIAWCRGPAGTAADWELFWNGKAFDFSMRDDQRGIAFDLSTTPDKPLIFQGPEGWSRKGESESAASLYYSFTRLATRGTVEVDGQALAVTGSSWMDKEFGSNQLEDDQVGWDWFSLQLKDGREIMLYLLRDATGAVDFGRGTLVLPEGDVQYLTAADWSVSATGSWTSPTSGVRYPSGWAVAIPSLDLDVTVRPLLESQENVSVRSIGIGYWEGAVEILGPRGSLGRGYVELTGYGDLNRPGL